MYEYFEVTPRRWKNGIFVGRRRGGGGLVELSRGQEEVECKELDQKDETNCTVAPVLRARSFSLSVSVPERCVCAYIVVGGYCRYQLVVR